MLTRPYLVLCFAMAMATMGIGMATPILPVYAKELGASGAAVGLTFSSFALTQVLISPFSGRMADQYGRKPFLILGLVTYVIAAAGWWLTSDVTSAILLRAFSGVGSALIFSLASAYIGDLAPEGQEGRFMGVFGVATFAGMGLGPLVAGVIRDQTDIDTVFLSMAILFAVSSAAVWLLLPRQARRADGGEAAIVPPAPWASILRNRVVQALFTVRTAFSFSMGASFSFVAIYLEEELLASATMVGVLLAGQQLTGGILQAPAGLLADRMSRRQLVMIGAILVAVGYLSIAMTEVYWIILLGFVLGVGVGSALINVAAQAIQVDVGRELGMATSMSLMSMAFAAGILLGSLGGGFVVEATSVAAVFGLASVAMLAGAGVFLALTREAPPAPAVAVGMSASEAHDNAAGN
ncbi:MAG: MFS transporter [Dehalococcoidia bacterium]|nr:MFS transporter [Dehalococcoidia bacterium]